jgi:hypothetical protein
VPDLDWSAMVGYGIISGYMTGGFGKSEFASVVSTN